MNPEDIPDVPSLPVRENWFDRMPPDLEPLLKRFSLGFLDEVIQEHGVERVVRCLRDMEGSIAAGRLKCAKAHAWKVMLGNLKRSYSDDKIAKAVNVKRRALPILLETGEPYQVGDVSVRRSAEHWFVNGSPWRSGVERLTMFLMSKAQAAGWKIRPLSPEAMTRLKDFPMFFQGG
jgi:hypothetical protein